MSSRNQTQTTIPQVLALAKLTGRGKISMNKAVREYLGFKAGQKLCLESGAESVLTARKRKGAAELTVEKNGVVLPAEVMGRLGVGRGDLVCLAERDGKLAVKAFATQKREGKEARWFDVETPYVITRTVETNPMPEEFLERLRKRYERTKLRGDVHAFLKNRSTYEALLARKILGAENPTDDRLSADMIKSRLDSQQKDGSWKSSVTITARNLRELSYLGLQKDHINVRRAVDWLTARPESPYNPGMWFVLDELVREQAEVIEQRKKHPGKGPRPRFNQTKASEVNLVRAGDPAIVDPCGARIMWTTALVLESLLLLGLENKKRVRNALRTLITNPNWCDCNYQHGLTAWGATEPVADKLLDLARERVIQFYRCGGVADPAAFASPGSANRCRRAAVRRRKNHDEYQLKMPLGLGESCKIIMTRALRFLKTGKLAELFELRLWEFAAVLNLSETRAKNLGKEDFTDRALLFLEIFAGSDRPVAKLPVARMLPWMKNTQNRDGSWGSEGSKDVTTLAVVKALAGLDRYWSSRIVLSD